MLPDTCNQISMHNTFCRESPLSWQIVNQAYSIVFFSYSSLQFMFCSRQLKADILSKILSALYDLNATYCIQTFTNIFEDKTQVKQSKHFEDKLPITNTCACVGSHFA